MEKTRYLHIDPALEDYTTWYIYNKARVVTLEDSVEFLTRAISGRLYLCHLMRNKMSTLRNRYGSVTDLDRALDEFTNWYATNIDTIVDVLPLISFLKKATDDTLHILHLMRQELKVLDAKAEESLPIFTPDGFFR